MPKLNDTHRPDRLRKRISELEKGESVAAKDISAVLTPEQRTALDAAWIEQQRLRVGSRATTDAQKEARGLKSKREVRLEILRKALTDAEVNLSNTYANLLNKAEVRQSRIYFDTYGAAVNAGHNNQQAKAMANRALKQSNLAKLDGQVVNRIRKRDMEILKQEHEILGGDGQVGEVGQVGGDGE